MCSYIFEEAQVIYSIVNLQCILGYYVNRFQSYVITPSGTTVDYKNECSTCDITQLLTFEPV